MLEPSKLVDGYNHLLDLTADKLDGGTDALHPATRATKLRAAVVAEIMDAQDDDQIGPSTRITRFSALIQAKI